jgi:hypothetical protein
MVNEGNEQNSTPEPETAGTGAAPTRSAEKLTRDELAGVARADAAAGYPEYDIAGRYNREVQALRRLTRREPSIVIEPCPARNIGGGAEHLVEQSYGPARVLKFTRDGEQNPSVTADFGYVVDSTYDLVGTGGYKGTLILRPATPSEYICRNDAQNEVFGDDLTIEGIACINNRLGLVVSQRVIKGTEPSLTENECLMEKGGFLRVKASKISSPHIVGNLVRSQLPNTD